MRLVVCCIALLIAKAAAGLAVHWQEEEELTRADFPKEFVFGAGTSAYQVEGAANEDGRTPSIWDTFVHAGFIPAQGTGDIAADEYHKYKEDVKLMKEMGLEGYRFSISWSRLIPNGRGAVNQKGLKYYNDLIDELINHGIEPHATLFHYDIPQILEDEYEGWLNRKAVDDFAAFADVCFREFGDRVRYWTTLNEPNIFLVGGYDVGIFAPGRCSYPFGYRNCTLGNSILEPYVAGHNLLLAHASAVLIYRTKYQALQNGSIGLNVFIYNYVPATNSPEDLTAAERSQDFYTGWFLKPITCGDYPESMKKNTGLKLPKFSLEESELLLHSFDFIGLNHYSSLYVKDDPNDKLPSERDFMGDMSAKSSGADPEAVTNGTFQNITSGEGLQAVLEYIKQVYGNPPIYIHENGYVLPHDGTLNDTQRVSFLGAHLKSLHDALRNGSNTIGYFVWSFLDLFEMFSGYQSTYGLIYVDFADDDRRRYPKLSAHWYSNFLRGGKIALESGQRNDSISASFL